VNIFSRKKLDRTGLDLCDSALDLAVPGSLCHEIGLSMNRIQLILSEASSIFGRQGLGSGGQFFNQGGHDDLRTQRLQLTEVARSLGLCDA
jgi:hypothetical protein